MIEVRNLRYTHQVGTPWECRALDDVSFSVEDGSFTGVLGLSGSGKTTLLRILCGLLEPQSGSVRVDGRPAIAFQFPENQLFRDTVVDDVMYGPLNMGLDAQDARTRAEQALAKVGLDPAETGNRSPFSLSGGEKRRAALAGVIAMEPDVLLVDEPTAGLDPAGVQAVLKCLEDLNRAGKTVVMVSHDPDVLSRCCSHVIVLEDGRISDQGTPSDVFGRNEEFRPQGLRLAHTLSSKL